MADVNESVVSNDVQAQAQPAPDAAQELKQWMDYSVLGKVPEVQQTQEVLSNEQQQVNEEVHTETAQVQAVADPFTPFKEKYGYQTPEDVYKDIEEYRKLKDAPPTFEFENDQSRSLFELIKEGKVKDVYNVLAQQERLESLTGLEVSKDNAADIIKYGMQLKYKDLTPQEIDFQFRKKFSYPKEPIQSDIESDDEYAIRKQEWQEQVSDIDLSKVIEAKLLKPELEAAKANIKFPEVQNNVDEEYIQWKKSLEDQPRIQTETKEAYNSFKPESIKTDLDFNDEANNIKFKFEFVPDAEGFESVRKAIAEGTILESYTNQDGTPNRAQFLRDLYYGKNIHKVLTEAMKQAKNAAIKSQLPDNVTGSGLNRQNSQSQELSEFDKMMQASLSVR